jgi:hypothetical protein
LAPFLWGEGGNPGKAWITGNGVGCVRESGEERFSGRDLGVKSGIRPVETDSSPKGTGKEKRLLGLSNLPSFHGVPFEPSGAPRPREGCELTSRNSA